MRGAYQRSQGHLQTAAPEATSDERIREEFKKQLLLVAGFKPEAMVPSERRGIR